MNNYVKKLSAFAVSAAMLLTAAGLNFVRPLEASEPVSGTRALTPLSAKALSATSADAGEAGLEQLDIALSAENSEQVDTACDTLTVLLEQELAAQNTMPDILDDPVLEARRQQYRNEITVRAARTRAALEAVRSGEADEEALQTIREAFSETGASHRSTATPSAAKHLQDAETEEGSLTKTAPQPLPETPPTTEETYLNSDTDIPEEVRNYAQNLGSAVEIYRFVKEKIVYEAYAGSKKGAEVTLDQFGGNDIDQARLLIAMLRSIGIPARYVTGTVEITAEQAVAITGAADVKSAGRILEARHKGVKGVTNQGSLVGYRMEQTWAEAYVPYTDYRGAGNAKGRSVWVPLDPSFKTLTTLTDTVTFDYSDDEKAVIAAMDALADEQPVIHADYVRPGSTAKVSVRSVDAADDGYLPASLPYTVLSVKERYAALPDEMKDSISIAVNGEELFSGLLTDLYLKRITVSYIPASDSDKKLLDSDAKLTEVPAYLVQMLPVVTVRGENGIDRYVGKHSAALGAMQQMTTTLKNEGDTTILTDDIFAGSVYAFNFDYQRIMPADISYSYDSLCTAKELANESNYAAPEIVGAMLDYAGKNYFILCDDSAQKYETAFNVVRNRQFGLCITGYQFNSKDTLGIVDKLENASFFIDVAYNNYAAISYEGSVESETGFNTALGFIESYNEGIVWECLTENNLRGISTVSVINAAKEKNIPIRLVCAANEEEALAACHISESVKNEVRDFVNKGMMVELVAETVSIGDWTGTAYIARDMQSGAASYMLSGGTAGGGSQCFDALFLLNNVMFVATLAIAGVKLCETSMKLLFVTPSRRLAGFASGISTAKALGKAFEMYFQNINFIYDYAMEGDAVLERFYDFTMANLERTKSYIASCIHGALSDIFCNVTYLFSEAYPLMKAIKAVFTGLNQTGKCMKDGMDLQDEYFDLKKLAGEDYEEKLAEHQRNCVNQAVKYIMTLLRLVGGEFLDGNDMDDFLKPEWEPSD